MKIKKPVVLVFLVLQVGLIQAQRFFYIDQNPITENLLKGGLLKAAQFITESPLSSDYTVETDIRFQTENNTLTLAMNLQDSATCQTLFQIRETCALGSLGPNARHFMGTIIQAFIERNIHQIVLSAKESHMDDRMNYLQTRKDKT